VDARVKGKIEFSVTGADISSNDNGALSQAAYYMISILDDLRDRQLITNDEFLRLIYRFFGETVDADDMLQRAAKENSDQGKHAEASLSQPSAGAEGGDTPTDVASGHAPVGVRRPSDRSAKNTER